MLTTKEFQLHFSVSTTIKCMKYSESCLLDINVDDLTGKGFKTKLSEKEICVIMKLFTVNFKLSLC